MDLLKEKGRQGRTGRSKEGNKEWKGQRGINREVVGTETRRKRR